MWWIGPRTAACRVHPPEKPQQKQKQRENAGSSYWKNGDAVMLETFGDEINHLPFGDLAVWWCLVCLFKMVVFHS